MQKRTIILTALGALGLVVLAGGRAYAAENDEAGAGGPEASDLSEGALVEGDPALAARLGAFRAVIRKFESGNDYGMLLGGGHFYDYSHHPNVRVPFFNPKTGRDDFSTAAGGYMINFPTYNEIAPALGITDFTPASQDAIANELLRRTGAYDAIAAGSIDTALNLAAARWASLPGSTAMQHPKSMAVALNAYDSFLTA